jgi:hypothetical protein
MAEAITEILSDHYPDALDTLIEEGVKAVNKGDLLQIELWATETINRLEEFGFNYLSSDKYIEDISNQINALNMLLNDLYTIKITKDGKISKQQKEANKRFGPTKQEVPDGTSVSPVQKPGAGSTEGVSPEKGRQAPTEDELRQIIKTARGTSSEFEDINNEPNPEEMSAKTKKYLKQIDKTKSVEEVDAILKDAIIQALKDKTIDLGTIIEFAEEKKQWHNTEIYEGDYVIATKEFGEVVEEGDIFLVKKITKDGAVLQLHGTNITETFTTDELSNFNKITEDMVPEEEVEINQEDIQNSEESAANLAEIAKKVDELNERNEGIKNTSRADRWKNLKDNSKHC